MSPLETLVALQDPDRAAQMAAYHKVPRRYLGVPVPQIRDLAAQWRAERDLAARLALAAHLWDSDIHEARVAAAVLLTQARIRPDDSAVWAEFCRWVPMFDAWALADHACTAGSRRVMADLSRLDQLESWTSDENMWVRRAALVVTLPLTRLNHPAAAQQDARTRILGWAATMASDPDWFIQKAIGWWLRDLSKHAPDMTRAFLVLHGTTLKPFARREAARYLADS